MQITFAVFAPETFLDLAAKEMRKQLDAIADAQDGDAQRKDAFVRQRRVFGINARRPAGQNDAFGVKLRDLVRRNVVAQNLRIDVALADAPGDELTSRVGYSFQKELRTGLRVLVFGVGLAVAWAKPAVAEPGSEPVPQPAVP